MMSQKLKNEEKELVKREEIRKMVFTQQTIPATCRAERKDTKGSFTRVIKFVATYKVWGQTKPKQIDILCIPFVYKLLVSKPKPILYQLSSSVNVFTLSAEFGQPVIFLPSSGSSLISNIKPQR